MPSSLADLLVVGSINVDLVVRVEHLPRAGETVSGGAFARHMGGKGGNQAVSAARLGATVTFVGAVGRDESGEAALADLAGEGIDVTGVARLPGVATGVALIVVDHRGENQIAVASGANARLDAQLVERGLAGVEAAPTAVYLANLEVPDEAVLAGARFASQRGLRIVINPAPARPLPAELLGLRPILLPNAGEAQLLSGETDAGSAAGALARSTGAPVVVTLGEHGTLLCEGDAPRHFAAHAVEALDTTGAGDTFAGAFAAELARGSPVEAALRLALAAAALSVTRTGARGGMPRRDQLEALTG